MSELAPSFNEVAGLRDKIERLHDEIERLRTALRKIADCDLEYGVAHRTYAKIALTETR
jgi:hypothetical protein